MRAFNDCVQPGGLCGHSALHLTIGAKRPFSKSAAAA